MAAIRKLVDHWSGHHPAQRVGALLLAGGLVMFAYWLIDEQPSRWAIGRVWDRIPECLLARCYGDGPFVAIRLIAAGVALRFLAVPLLKWLRAGSPSR